MAAAMWNVYVGSETGLFKGVNTEKNSFKNLNPLTGLGRDHEITALCWENSSEDKIYIGQRNQSLKIYDCSKNFFEKQFNLAVGDGPIKGVAHYNNCMLTAVESGIVKLWKEDEEKELVEINAGQNLNKMCQNIAKPQIIATGGEENDLKIWDLERPEEPIFKAKNVRNDFLDLRVPVWVTDMQFLPDSDKIVTCTRHHHIRLYDPNSSQRRPVISMEFEKYPLMSLSLAHREHQLIVGSSRGRMALMDLRKKALVHVFKGFAGSIRCVRCHPTLPLVASCGLDRFLRIHELNKHTLLKKIYLKTRLNCLVIRSEFNSTAVGEQADDTEKKEVEVKCDTENKTQDEDNEIWERMKVVKDKSLRRKRTAADHTNRLTDIEKRPKLKRLID